MELRDEKITTSQQIQWQNAEKKSGYYPGILNLTQLFFKNREKFKYPCILESERICCKQRKKILRNKKCGSIKEFLQVNKVLVIPNSNFNNTFPRSRITMVTML